MLRAGFCDFGTCDLEIGCQPVQRAQSAGDCLRLARPPREPSRPSAERGGQPGARSLGTPPGPRSAADRRPAARSAGGAADLRRYRPAGDSLPHLRPPGGARFQHGRREFPAPGARRFRTAAVAFPARQAPRVSHPSAAAFPRVPRRFLPGAAEFPRGHRGVSPEGGRRAAARSLRGRPRGPAAGSPPPDPAALFPGV